MGTTGRFGGGGHGLTGPKHICKLMLNFCLFFFAAIFEFLRNEIDMFGFNPEQTNDK